MTDGKQLQNHADQKDKQAKNGDQSIHSLSKPLVLLRDKWSAGVLQLIPAVFGQKAWYNLDKEIRE